MKSKKLIFLASILITSGVALTSCVSEREEKDDSGKSYIYCWINEGNKYEGAKKDSVLRKIEDTCGVNLQVTGTTHNDTYYTTLNPKVNTGEILDILFTVPTAQGDGYSEWIDQGLLCDYDTLMAEKPGEYPYLEAIFESDAYKNIQYGDDLHTLLPFITSKNSWTIYYRADWLREIGYVAKDSNGNALYELDYKGNQILDSITGEPLLKARAPVNMDEFEDVMIKFKEKHPQTYPLSPGNSATWLNPLYHAFGCTTDYDIIDGKVTHHYLQPEYKNFLNWAQKMCSLGLIDPNFGINSNNGDRDKFYDSKSGILITNGESHVQWILSRFATGQVIVGPAPVGTANIGKEGCGGFSDWGGWWGGFSLSSQCTDKHAAMRFLNYICGPEGNNLFHNGIEGVHYDLVNNEVVPNLDGRYEEPEGTFYTVDVENGVKEPVGMHELGSHFQGRLVWTSDREFTFIPDNTSIPLQYKDYFDQTVQLNTLVTSKLTNVTGWPSSYLVKMRKVEDACNAYTIETIVGRKNTTTDYEALLAKIEQPTYEWSSIQRMIKEVARKHGIN